MYVVCMFNNSHSKRQPLTRRPVFVVSYDPSLTQIITEHWRYMGTQNDYLGLVYPEPPLVSYRRQKNKENLQSGQR